MKRMLVPVLLLVLVTIVGADYVKLQPDPDTGEDAYVYANQPNQNFGTDDYLSLQPSSSGGSTAFYIEFTQVDNYLGSTCTDAYLGMEVVSAGSTDTTGFRMGPVSGSWDESTITWNTMPGVHYSDSHSYPTDIGPWVINVQSVVQDWFDGTHDNNGFCFFDNDGPFGESVCCFSSDYQTAGSRPYLEIYYTPASAVEEASWGAVKALD